MKKILFNISDSNFEKFRIEAEEMHMDVTRLIKERIFERPFSHSVQEKYDKMIEAGYRKIIENEWDK